MEKLRNAIKKYNFKKQELGGYLDVTLDELDFYISEYEEESYEFIPEDIKKVFDFMIDTLGLYSKDDVIAYIMSLDDLLKSNEEYPYIKKMNINIKSKNPQELVDELTSMNIEVMEYDPNVWSFVITHSCIEGTFTLFDYNTMNYEKTYKTVVSAKEVNTLKDIYKVLSNIHKSYVKAAERAAKIVEEINESKAFINRLKEDGTYDEISKKLETPTDYDMSNVNIHTYDQHLLLEEINGMVKSCLDTFKPMALTDLEKIRTILSDYFPKYSVVWRGKEYAVIKNNKAFSLSVCIVDQVYDPSNPFSVNDLAVQIGGIAYYIIKTFDGYCGIDIALDVAQYLDDRVG